MSPAFKNVLIAILTAGLAFFIWLDHRNGLFIDKLLWPQQVEFECVPPEEARARKARCVVIERQTA